MKKLSLKPLTQMVFGKNLGGLLNRGNEETEDVEDVEQLETGLSDAAVHKYLGEWKDILQVTAELRYDEGDHSVILEEVRNTLEEHGLEVEGYTEAVEERDRLAEGKDFNLQQQNLYEHITKIAGEAGFEEKEFMKQRSISDQQKNVEATTQYEVMSEIDPVGAAYWHLKSNPFGETTEDLHEFFTEELDYDQVEDRPSTVQEVEQLLQRAEDLGEREQWFAYGEDGELHPTLSSYAQGRLSDTEEKLLQKNLG